MLKKIFGELKMSWVTVLILAVISGVYTALMAMLVPDNCSFHDIAVTMEVWILLAIIIITNCEKPLEAAAKTFVFFLISQPLVYLIQVPFSPMGWGIFGYYRYWFIVTLLTFPGAFIGWFIVDAKMQGQGIGSQIFADIRAALAGLGYDKLRLGCVEGNEEGEKFWLSMGFSFNGAKEEQEHYTVRYMERDI